MLLRNVPEIDEFKKEHANSIKPLDAWIQLIKENEFKHLMELRKTFNSVDYVEADDLYIFNIGGNKFRLKARIIFKLQEVYVEKVETHDAYSKTRKGKRK